MAKKSFGGRILFLLKFISALTVSSLIMPAYSLTIIPTFDSSITSSTNAVAITNAIYFAIGVLQANLIDKVTVKIKFVSDESVGLGENSTWGNDYNYSTFLTALKKHAHSTTDTNALSKLPSSSHDPLVGNTMLFATLPLARLLGLDSGYGSDGFDSTISCAMSLMNFTRPPADLDKYDLATVLEHEMDEVLGISSNLPRTEISPADLFRYTTNLTRTYTTSGDDAYFSANGTNLVARYNMDGYGDYGDWWSYSEYWSPITGDNMNHPQVQDAYGTSGSFQDLGVSELTILDVVGWTLAVPSSVNPLLKIVNNGASQFTVSWTNTATGYVLQESTNFPAVTWTFSTIGSTNPASISTSSGQKFYRLYKPATSLELPGPGVVIAPSPHSPLKAVTHIYRPRQSNAQPAGDAF